MEGGVAVLSVPLTVRLSLVSTPQAREKGKMRVHKLQNVQNSLDYLQKVKRIKLVNIRNDEIVDGNTKLILGLLWTLILHFQVCMSVGTYTGTTGVGVHFICWMLYVLCHYAYVCLLGMLVHWAPSPLGTRINCSD